MTKQQFSRLLSNAARELEQNDPIPGVPGWIIDECNGIVSRLFELASFVDDEATRQPGDPKLVDEIIDLLGIK